MIVALNTTEPQKISSFRKRVRLYVFNLSAASIVRLGTSQEELKTPGAVQGTLASQPDGWPVPPNTGFIDWWDGDLWLMAEQTGQQVIVLTPGHPGNSAPLDPGATVQPGFQTEDNDD